MSSVDLHMHEHSTAGCFNDDWDMDAVGGTSNLIPACASGGKAGDAYIDERSSFDDNDGEDEDDEYIKEYELRELRGWVEDETELWGFFVQDEIDAETEDFVRLENKIPNIPPQYSRLRLEAILLIVPKFFMFPVPIGYEAEIANELRRRRDLEGKDYLIYNHRHIPHRVYVGAPSFLRIVNFMRRAGYENLIPRAVPIGDTFPRTFFDFKDPPKPPPAFSFVKITQDGLYWGDFALVLWVHDGDLLTLAVVPRVSFNGKDDNDRLLRARLCSQALWGLSFDSTTGHYAYGTRRFTSDGFEILLAQCSHGLASVEAPRDVVRAFEGAFVPPPPTEHPEHPAPKTDAPPLAEWATLETSGRLVRQWELQRLGKEVAVIEGNSKGYHGRLVGFNRDSATVEFGGRQKPTMVIPLQSLVLLEKPTHDLAGNKLQKPYVAKNLDRPEPPRPPRPSTPPHVASLEWEGDPFGPNGTAADVPESQKPVDLGSGAFLRDPEVLKDLDDLHIWVAFNASFERGSFIKRNGWTPPRDRFTDSDGDCAPDEICLSWKDNRSIRVNKRVKLFHLKPAPPRAKGERFVVISGPDRGFLGVVDECKKKDCRVIAVKNNVKMTFMFSNICRVTKEP